MKRIEFQDINNVSLGSHSKVKVKPVEKYSETEDKVKIKKVFRKYIIIIVMSIISIIILAALSYFVINTFLKKKKMTKMKLEKIKM